MKKYTLILASLLTASAAFAQSQEENPNRILVNDKGGAYKGFVIDYLDNISFARVEGEVLAEVTVDRVGLTEMALTIIRTPECSAYRLAVLPQTTANQLGNDANAIRYINTLPPSEVPTLYEDFVEGTLSGISLNPDSKYSIITIGIDCYGIEAGVYRADFETPRPSIVGNPHVGMSNVSATQYSFTCTFTPNDDVQQYWLVAGETGTMQEQYEQFAPMFGFTNFSQMISMWGVPCMGQTDHTWTDMSPNTEYEIFVAMTDANGNFAPYETYTVSTGSLGGHGEAKVNISLGTFSATEWDGMMAPTQEIVFTPNDQASCYRMGVYTAESYDAEADAIKDDLRSDPPMPMAYWFFYDETTSKYKVELSKNYVAIAAAKNIDGQWGPVTEYRFTTPDSCPGYNRIPSVSSKAPKARYPKMNVHQKGVLPQLRKSTLTLTQN